MVNKRDQFQKATYYIISFTRSVQDRQMHRDRKQISGFLKLGITAAGGADGGVTASEHGFLFRMMKILGNLWWWWLYNCECMHCH